MEEIKAYKPSCCNKAYVNKSSARQHEKRCPHNPLNHACVTCGYNSEEQETVYVRPHEGENYGDADYERYYYWCSYHEKELSKYPSTEDEDDSIQITMNCEHWKQKNEY